MSQIDNSIYFQQQSPNLVGSYQEGLKMADLANQRNKNKLLKEAFQLSIDKDPITGESKLNETKLMSNLLPIDPDKAMELKTQIDTQKAKQITLNLMQKNKDRELSIKERLLNNKLNKNSSAKAPPGYRFKRDGSLEAIPGGPAWNKENKTRIEQETNASTVTRAGQTLIRDVSTAIENIDNNGRWAAGYGSAMKWIPESDSNALAADIASIQGNVAVDQLLKIKKSGAGLGQVPQSQLEMLASLLGGLRQDMPPEKLKKNLLDIKGIYQEIIEAEGGDPFELSRKRGFTESLPAIDLNEISDAELNKMYLEAGGK